MIPRKHQGAGAINGEVINTAILIDKLDNLFCRKIKDFSDVQKYLRAITNIHRGGCGVSALAMFRWLKNNNKLEDTRFVYLYDDKEAYLNNNRILRNHEGIPKGAMHVVLLHEGKFIDCYGDVNIANHGEWVQIIDEVEFIEKSVSNRKGWNQTFGRENIEKIENKLEIDLSDIKRGDV